MESNHKPECLPTFLRQRRDKKKNKASYVLHHQDNTVTDVELLSLQPQHEVTIFQVIHGVVCLAYTLDRFSQHPQFIAFWNPTVRKYVSTPLPFDSERDYIYNFIGFGFDSYKNEFKAIWSSCGSKYYKVFSTCDNIWTKKPLPKHVNSLKYESESCFINGKIHWVTSPIEVSKKEFTYTLFELRNGREGPHGLTMFDCEREKFTTMELPEPVRDMDGDKRVFEFRGLLSVLTSGWRGKMVCELWTMNEYGLASTWTKTQIVDTSMSRQVAIDYEQIDVRMIGKSAYVFKESMLLRDIGQSST